MSNRIKCPLCGNHIYKNGKTKSGVQRYRCQLCLKTFMSDQSPTKHFKNSSKLIKKFIGYMIDDVTLDVAARNLEINIKTAHYYRYIVFHTLLNYQDEIELSDSIMIDETFLSIREKKYKILRLDGKDIRGLSFNQLCVITMINLRGLCLAKVSSRGMASPGDFIRLFNQNIGSVNKFLHDGNPKQVQFMNQFDIEKINARRNDSEEYSTIIVDSLHSNIKRYLFKHAGFRLKYLQHYLNFFVYRYNQLILSDSKNKTEQLQAKN
ncbi:IS1/IS1595 family N-terminal zinc-binding domain-containing protein [Peloplasma aerotolerans]|uniref:Transposase n=1 Tax=Peloplasma aerotolerans TaxID=3044389 RepID=A0AAW6U5E0_9MOLU|nr:transposase [Mariniplasma sp. M4Ah]MDI6453075.1 transposase [Mariniplasma sp. M4Ah]